MDLARLSSGLRVAAGSLATLARGIRRDDDGGWAIGKEASDLCRSLSEPQRGRRVLSIAAATPNGKLGVGRGADGMRARLRRIVN
jgi:hypothetical protein